MMGAAGALCCLLAGTAAGSWLRDRRLKRAQTLCTEMEAIGGMRLLLEQERLGLPELLEESARYAVGDSGERVAERLTATARALEQEPLLGVEQAYRQACARSPIPWERQEERDAMEALFMQLGSGTAAMRAQAAAACLRRLKPLAQAAREGAEASGKLCMQLGVLLGLMAGIALW
ncbi:MAG: stage III sporulation protein AB [Clostridiales bacterium]|nr:stage III sporulation protein AB [Clostridiales bacterium]MDO4351264.1 hypothetical protein [Eubacteriales bacterium]MDY4009462.1 hypothetical protein [Candidatus Limiplasma sp.]